MPMARTWEGMTIQQKMERASGRAIVGIAMQVARETKILTHRVSGNLARSVHAAPPGYADEAGDVAAVEGGADLLMGGATPVITPEGAIIEVGSWLPYACVEWIGRRHPGIIQGLELGRSKANMIVSQAFREEGL